MITVIAPTVEEVDAAWGCACFGQMPRHEVLKRALLWCACGYKGGSTSTRITKELGLISEENKLTKLGEWCLWIWFGENRDLRREKGGE